MPKIKLALNLSAAAATDPQWLEGLEAFLRKGQGLAARLTIEITETAAISDLEETAKFVAALKRLGSVWRSTISAWAIPRSAICACSASTW
jgi:EAL domain-containing protein (putative c-di-GMP-specific phosphodiesterase class I)